MQWLTDVLFNAPVADQYPVFVVQNADVLGLFGWEQSDRKYFSFAEFTPFLKQIDEQGAQVGQTRSGPALRLSERDPEPAQRAGAVSTLKEQHSARGHAKFCRGAAELRKQCPGRGEGGSQTRNGRKFR